MEEEIKEPTVVDVPNRVFNMKRLSVLSIRPNASQFDLQSSSSTKSLSPIQEIVSKEEFEYMK